MQQPASQNRRPETKVAHLFALYCRPLDAPAPAAGARVLSYASTKGPLLPLSPPVSRLKVASLSSAVLEAAPNSECLVPPAGVQESLDELGAPGADWTPPPSEVTI